MFSVEKIGLLIIFFNPTKEDILNSQRNISYFNSGIIVWNSEKTFEVSNPNFFEIELTENLGQAKALNIGFEKAISMNLELLLTLDQDSKFIDKGEKLLKIINSHHHQFLNPAGFSFLSVSDKETNKKNYKNYYPDLTLTTITSGTIYLTSAWKKIYGFKNELFIEGIDTEYSIRARRNKLNFYKFDYPIFIHDAGSALTKKFLNLKITIRVHSDIRLYLQYRNNLPIFIRNIIFVPKWSLKSIINLYTKKLIIAILGSKNILRTLIWILKGTCVGLLELTSFSHKLKSQELMFKTHIKD